MVDSCFKIFRKSKCLDNKSSESHRGSFDSSSLFNANTEEKLVVTRNHKGSLITPIIDIENQTILRSNKGIIDHHSDNDNEYSEYDDLSILRPHNRRKYLYSTTSTTASNEILSSDEDSETLDVLYPLHNERCLASGGEDSMHCGMNDDVFKLVSSPILLIIFSTDKCPLASQDNGNNDKRVRHDSSSYLLKSLLKTKYKRKVKSFYIYFRYNSI